MSDGAGSDGIHLDTKALTFNGAPFDASADVWILPGAERNLSIRFDAVHGADRTLIPAMKGTLSWYAQHRSDAHLRGCYERLRHFFRHMAADTGVPVAVITADLWA